MGFIERHGLWTQEQSEAASEIAAHIAAEGVNVVRLVFADQHGVLRGKTLIAEHLPEVLQDGLGIVSSLLFKDTSGRTALPIFHKTGGLGVVETRNAADMVMIPDPTTIRFLPWADRSAWLLCDLWFPDGQPVPFSSRGVLRRTLEEAKGMGYELMVGLEVEFHLFPLADPHLALSDVGQPGTPPDVGLLNHGYQLLSEERFDEVSPIFEILRDSLLRLGVPLRTLEVEFGPSQLEMTVSPQRGLDPADTMVLLRSAIKQVARRHGYHATFMCRPQVPDAFASGWHLHQSLWHISEQDSSFNVFSGSTTTDGLSETGRRYLAGLLAHASGASAFSTPTVNGYKRYRSYSLAPDRAVWGLDNRGAMVRVVGSGLGSDSSVRLENRMGEPAANPYLYIASQLVAGLDGIRRKLDPGPRCDDPYEKLAPSLPTSLGKALDALEVDIELRAGMGEALTDYYVALKRAELSRFETAVTDWEQREYFQLF